MPWCCCIEPNLKVSPLLTSLVPCCEIWGYIWVLLQNHGIHHIKLVEIFPFINPDAALKLSLLLFPTSSKISLLLLLMAMKIFIVACNGSHRVKWKDAEQGEYLLWSNSVDWNGPGPNINSGPVFSASRGLHCCLCAVTPRPTRMDHICSKHMHIYSHMAWKPQSQGRQTFETVNILKLPWGWRMLMQHSGTVGR